MKVVLNVSEIRASLPYSSASIVVNPVLDTLIGIEVDDSHVSMTDKAMVLEIEGIRTIIKGLKVALVIDSDADGEF